MKTMVIIQNEAERKALLDIWNALQADKGSQHVMDWHNIKSGLFARLNEVNMVFDNKAGRKGNDYAIVYDLLEDGWHIYNFNTMEEEVISEGDLAGLTNSKPGNFPFFN